MTRTPIIAGNWKMNTVKATAKDLADSIKAAGLVEGVDSIICPPFPFLDVVAESVRGTTIRVGAQNLHWEEKGAFTGEVSATMLSGLVQCVIIGHSERRAYFGDTDETVNRKLQAALAGGLVPIFCIGETGAERNDGQTLEVLKRQLYGGLEGVSLLPSSVIAYEPVWAIGTGEAATTEDASLAIGFIRQELALLQGQETAAQVRILYGGSATPANVADFVAQDEVDGALVGGASLDSGSFLEMLRSVAALVNP